LSSHPNYDWTWIEGRDKSDRTEFYGKYETPNNYIRAFSIIMTCIHTNYMLKHQLIGVKFIKGELGAEGEHKAIVLETKVAFEH
jgi:hypothetical protein